MIEKVKLNEVAKDLNISGKDLTALLQQRFGGEAKKPQTVLSGEELKSLDFTEVRGTDGIKEASYTVNGMEVKVCVVSGLANANTIMEKVKNGTADYHFIEIMGCPGGCVNGGGQPIQHAVVRNFVDLRARRAAALYEADKDMPLRKSHESEAVKRLYAEFLGEPGSHKAHEVLHTSYVARPKYK